MANIELCFDLSGIKVFVLRKVLTELEAKECLGKFKDKFNLVVNYDADVFDTDGKLILRFRKNVLDKKLAKDAREALGKFVEQKSDLRSISSGTPGKKTSVHSNILGFMDKHNTTAIHNAKKFNKPLPDTKKPRISAWTRDNPELFQKLFPYIEAIDAQYKNLCPTNYESQKKAADECEPFRISNTSFTTVTVNKNYRTAAHLDKGDWEEGFGNLTVYESGAYEGGYTGFPEYDVCVDVRSGDFLAMDVHRPHCNTPLIGTDFERISFVCYLRKGIHSKLKRLSS